MILLDSPPQIILPDVASAPAIIRPGVDLERYFPVELRASQRGSIARELSAKGEVDRREACRLVEAALPFGFYKAGPTLALTFVAVSTSATNTVTSPSGIQAGDLLVVFDTAYNASSGPATVIPSGFTNGKLFAGVNGRVFKSLISHKIATGSESSTSFSGMNSTSEVKCFWVFRPSQPIVPVDYAPTWGEEVTSGNPGAQSTTDAASQSGGSLLIVGAAHALDVDPVYVTESPAFDGNNVSGTGSTIHGRFGRKIYNASPQDHTIDMNDQGTFNGLIIGWINVT